MSIIGERFPVMAQRSQAHVALGRAVRSFREDLGLSQEELADRSGMHRTYVGGIERGERNVSYANMLRLAGALGVPASRLLTQAEGDEGDGGDGGRGAGGGGEGGRDGDGDGEGGREG